ncbi:MAG TPA: outer membrane beta-barrel protein [Terriglobales bacterium]|nr:outer membrane beta-barrel protein [Terriglobales bacterium]
MSKSIHIVCALALFGCGWLPAQAQEEHKPRWTIHLSLGVANPMGSVSDFAKQGGVMTVGAGRRFGKLDVVGEFLFNQFGMNDSMLHLLQVSGGDGNVYGYTANARYTLVTRGKWGGYVMGGGGLYRRALSVSQPSSAVITDPRAAPILSPAGQVLNDVADNAAGFNAGGGVTRRLGGEESLRAYVEARYHYASTPKGTTELLPVTIGVRW